MQNQNKIPTEEAVSQAILDASTKPVELIVKPDDYVPLKQSEVSSVQNAMNQDVLRNLGKRVVGLEDERLIDQKTGAGSELAFQEDLQEMLNTRPEDVRIMLLDLNGFKEFNDTLGHEVGDEALRQFVGGIEEVALRTGEKLYRIGGDEFVVLSDLRARRDRRQKDQSVEHDRREEQDRRQQQEHDDSRRTEDVKKLGRDDTSSGLKKRIRNGFIGADYIFHGYLERVNLVNEAEPGDENYIEPSDWRIKASWGVADYEDGDTLESLKERADVAMYDMKRGEVKTNLKSEQLTLFDTVT